jgi:hypothetical protein
MSTGGWQPMVEQGQACSHKPKPPGACPPRPHHDRHDGAPALEPPPAFVPLPAIEQHGIGVGRVVQRRRRGAGRACRRRRRAAAAARAARAAGAAAGRRACGTAGLAGALAGHGEAEGGRRCRRRRGSGVLHEAHAAPGARRRGGREVQWAMRRCRPRGGRGRPGHPLSNTCTPAPNQTITNQILMPHLNSS